jgi:outer membrane biosynthesis protein TonB
MMERTAGRRRGSRPGVGSALASLLIHGAAVGVAVLLAGAAPALDQFVSYDIELVSMPGPDLGDLVVEAPPSAPSEAPPPTPQPVVKEPEPKPKPKETKQPTPSETPPKQTQGRPNPSAGESSGAESAEAMNIRIEGLRRDYPVFYNNIILQIKRCFRWSGQGSPEAEIYFVINKDGTVSDLRHVRKSGNAAFDYDALGAIECAGQPGRFGPLPDDLPFDRLPIRFRFRPGNVDGIFR